MPDLMWLKCQQFLQDEGIEAMNWPARSPDLNLIEHIWDIMSHAIHQRHVAPQTVQELADALVQVVLNTFHYVMNKELQLEYFIHLLHLSIIHTVPEMSLYFISLAPKEVLDIQNDLSQSALHLAVYLGQVRVVEALVDKEVNLELQDRRGDTALHLACEKEHLDCAALLLLRGPRRRQNLLQLQNWKGLSCLHIATMKRNPALISLLIERGADINSPEGNSGKTPLHLAVQMVDQPLLLHLLRHAPKVDALMYNGCTPLHLAVGSEDSGLARLLCQAGADVLQRNLEGDTPQDLAEGNNQLLALLPFDDLKISGKPVVTFPWKQRQVPKLQGDPDRIQKMQTHPNIPTWAVPERQRPLEMGQQNPIVKEFPWQSPDLPHSQTPPTNYLQNQGSVSRKMSMRYAKILHLPSCLPFLEERLKLSPTGEYPRRSALFPEVCDIDLNEGIHKE
ncbi:unnamed protein product [Ranitomeya imitator]|uniref:Uncharacterized protein n=1 Tax=Ranitomeya imitator TaxID=111125 RepID=A0ABN9M8G9_9NEOB|nr:unnamed protein product [Ranitomeya imitator]